MRAFRAVAGAVLGAVVLAGCGASGSGGGDDAPPTPRQAPTAAPTGPTAPAASTGPSPGGAASPTADKPPAADETLVRVSRSGGYAGQTHTLIVKGDGSWTRLDGKAQPEGAGKLSEAGLAALRTALREADFARLPRISTGEGKVFDGFMYAFVHGGYEVAAAEEALAPALRTVLDALPPFTAS
ncbi:hypothetical protein ACGFYQ_05375 [Streptomyces sp. NPDC048258]|uniref:hypothetical protein n=1 Tax=Streptomyces sp. NPDC048258 TaxID=3365527 RepID=UPI003715E8B5